MMQCYHTSDLMLVTLKPRQPREKMEKACSHYGLQGSPQSTLDMRFSKSKTVLTWIAIFVRWGRRVLGIVLVGLAAANDFVKQAYLLTDVGRTTRSKPLDLLHRVAAQNPRPAGELIHSLSNLRWCGHRVSNCRLFEKKSFCCAFGFNPSLGIGEKLFSSLFFLHRTRKTANFPINFHILFWHLMKGSLMSNDVHNK